MTGDVLRAAWHSALDRLEQDVLRCERLVTGAVTPPAEPWQPPEMAGPMPAELAARAARLLDRQERAAAELRAGLATAQRQLAYGDRVTEAAGAGPARPVYVDVDA